MITEDPLERQCLGWFRESGWQTVFGPNIAHDGTAPERANCREVVLVRRINPQGALNLYNSSHA